MRLLERRLLSLIFQGLLTLSSGAFAAPPSEFLDDLSTVMTRSPALSAEAERRRATKIEASSKNLFWTPTLSGQARRVVDHAHTGDPDQVTVDYGLIASWNLFRSGADVAAARAANANDKAQERRVVSETLKLENQAANLIFAILNLRDQLSMQKDLSALKAESTQILKQRFRQGRSPWEDVEKSEVDYSQQQIIIRQLSIELGRTESQLRGILFANLKTKSWPFSENAALKAESVQSPEIEQLENELHSRKSLINSARAGHGPRLDLNYSLSNQRFSEGRYPWDDSWRENSGDGPYPWTNTSRLELVLTIPLWEQRQVESAVADRRAEARQAETNLELAKSSLKENRLFLKEKLDSSRESLKEAINNLNRSEKLYRNYVRSFGMGRLSTNDLFIEQTRLLESRRDLAEMRLAFHQAVAEICMINGAHLKDCL